jgi:general secretion pathway protein A
MYKEYFGFRMDPFSATPDADLYYANAGNQEAFATLRYGITAKKGFTVITGEAGTGKTTLLHKLLRNLGPTVHSVFIFNTQINFDELLRLTLDDLGLARQADDRVTMVEALNQYLIERLKENHIVCLLIDEAQNLSAEALEGIRLLCNLETDKEKLLQIVLAGQPELEKQLGRPELRQLRQRVALQCRLAALAASEIGSYIDFRLKAAGYDGDRLFRPDAVERIGFYSEGIPRLVNIICDNALLTAYADSRKEISAEVIKEVAGDLRLSEGRQSQSSPKQPEVVPVPKEVSEETEWKIVPDEVRQSRLGLNDMPVGLRYDPPEAQRKSSAGLKMGALFTVVLVGSAGAFVYSDQARHFLSQMGFNFEHLVERGPVESVPAQQELKTHDDSSQAMVPAEQHSQPQPIVEENNPGTQPPVKSDITQSDRRKKKTSAPVVERPPIKVSNDPAIRKKKIEVAVDNAIQNRAIDGVSVSVVDSTVYLDGEVATERQRLAAERAARSVPDVKQVRNRLSVKFS